MKVKTENGSVPVFPYVVAKGYVALAYEDIYSINKDGIEEPHKKQKVRAAVIVSVGDDDNFNMDKMISVGRRVLMPSVNKQQFTIDGTEFYLCHHLDIKVFDPIDDEELALAYLQLHYDSLPKMVQQKFMIQYAGL